MGHFIYALIENLINTDYKIAIESGTLAGHGASLLSEYFEKVYTIEIDENLFNIAKERLKNNKKVICLHGDSKIVLPKLLDDDDINIQNENIVFWLDAHWSGDSSVDWEKSNWKGYNIDTGYVGEKINKIVPGPNQVPLEEEIYQIYHNCRKECILYIDDFNKINLKTLKGLKNIGFVGEDYSHLDFNKIFNYIDDRIIYKNIDHNYCILKFKSLNN